MYTSKSINRACSERLMHSDLNKQHFKKFSPLNLRAIHTETSCLV